MHWQRDNSLRSAEDHMNDGPGDGKMSSEEFKLRLQLETSLLVCVRTSLALMGFGFVVARFGLFLREVAEVGEIHLRTHRNLAALNTYTGTILILIGVATLLLSVWGHWRFVEQLERGELAMSSRWSLGVFLSIVLAVLGVGMAIYLAAIES
jgi:putative membrane protein